MIWTCRRSCAGRPARRNFHTYLMNAEYVNGTVRAPCAGCNGAKSAFLLRDAQREYGSVLFDSQHEFRGKSYKRIIFQLRRCGGCGRGSLAVIHDNGQVTNGVLEALYPQAPDFASLTISTPQDLVAEMREAEKCSAAGAWRAASALLRSVLEKTLKANGYTKGTLETKIDEAASDGVITVARAKRAHDNVRVLGNDILHDAWREVDESEYLDAHHYAQRILEDFYDHRPEIEDILKKKGRIS